MNIDKRSETFQRLSESPARYLVEREIVINGMGYGASKECANPAVGTMVLDGWEKDLIQQIEDAERRAA